MVIAGVPVTTASIRGFTVDNLPAIPNSMSIPEPEPNQESQVVVHAAVEFVFDGRLSVEAASLAVRQIIHSAGGRVLRKDEEIFLSDTPLDFDI